MLRTYRFTSRLICLAGLLAVTGCESEQETPDSPKPNVVTQAPPVEHDPAKLADARIPSELPPPGEPRPFRDDDWFRTRQSPDFAYRTGVEARLYELIESVGGGVAMFDFDRDGDLDLYFTGGGKLDAKEPHTRGLAGCLLRNDGDFQFSNITAAAGLAENAEYSHGCSTCDFDRDGDDDLLVCGYGGCRLYRNDAGKFVDCAQESGIVAPGWNIHGLWGDFDGDGWSDLYLITYAQWKVDLQRKCINDKNLHDICAPTHFPGDSDRLFRNRGDGSFEDVTAQAGLVAGNRGLGGVFADFNGDGKPDYFIANDVDANQLYLNTGELPFREEGSLFGVAFSTSGQKQGSMGVDAVDFNRDGLIDLFYANYSAEDNSLLANSQGSGFVDLTARYGLMGRSRAWVGFGCALADFDSDGHSDLVISNGHVAYDRNDAPYFQPAQFFRNSGRDAMEELTESVGSYFSVPHSGRGLAVGDLDNDGDLDLVIVHQDAPPAILENLRACEHWVRLQLRGAASEPAAFGARVHIENDDDARMFALVSGRGYLSQFDPRILIPLESSQPRDILVEWPTGKTERFLQLGPGQTHEIVEGQGTPVESP